MREIQIRTGEKRGKRKFGRGDRLIDMDTLDNRQTRRQNLTHLWRGGKPRLPYALRYTQLCHFNFI